MPRSLAAIRYYAGSIVTLLTQFRHPLQVTRLFLGPSRFGRAEIVHRGTGLRFVVRSKMDIWSVKEAVADRLYEVYGFALEPGWTIVDIGAALGEFTLVAATHDAGNRVHAYEPFPESFGLLQENLALNRLQNVSVFPEAVSAEAGDLLLDISSGEPLKMESGTAVNAEREHIAVRAVSLGDVLDRLGTASPDVLKLDCEGAEYDILMRAAPEHLARIPRIVMEYHDHRADFQHPALVAFLEHAGYRVDVFPNVVHPGEIGYMRAIRP